VTRKDSGRPNQRLVTLEKVIDPRDSLTLTRVGANRRHGPLLALRAGERPGCLQRHHASILRCQSSFASHTVPILGRLEGFNLASSQAFAR
jgi:hypothetical protein